MTNSRLSMLKALEALDVEGANRVVVGLCVEKHLLGGDEHLKLPSQKTNRRTHCRSVADLVLATPAAGGNAGAAEGNSAALLPGSLVNIYSGCT